MSIPNVLRTVLFYGSRPVVWFLFGLMTWRAERSQVGPFEVIVVSRAAGIREHVVKLQSAAELLREFDRSRYKRVTEAIRLIVIVDHDRAMVAEYHHSTKAILLQAKALETLNVPGLGALLAHEATHARIMNLGIHHTASASHRIERLCLRNEIWFLERVPSGRVLAEVKRQRLAADEV